MVHHKAQLKKQQKRGVDFKKIKRKIGRKLPPPKNTTNTEVKSKAIILPEQSVASEKAGLAVSKKGLTLKELLQQTSHHNAKVRRDALLGIRDIFLKHPAELKMHRLFVIEKLRERMSDEDKMVRETLYQLLKAVIFPSCKEDNQGTFISLMMAYAFNAMTHLSVDVRLMAFKFFDLIVQHYPQSFSMYAEKIIQHYKEILQKNQFNLHDKGKLKSVFSGLADCLSLLPKPYDNTSTKKAVADRRVLHAYEPEMPEDRFASSPVVAEELKGLLPILVGGFQDFMPSVQTMPTLEAQSFDCVLSILKSIDHVVKFFAFVNSRNEPRFKFSPASNRRDQEVWQIQLEKLYDVFPLNPTHQSSEKDDNRYFILNVIVSEIFFCLNDWSSSAFLEKFLAFIVDALSEKVCGTLHSGKAFFQKHSLPLIPFIPQLILQVDDPWKSHILQAFTEVFKKCDPESSLKLACIPAIEEMIWPKNICPPLKRSDSEIMDFQIPWIREIPLLLTVVGDKNPSYSMSVVRFLHHLGQWARVHPLVLQEFESMQLSLREFYSIYHDGDISYGPFMKLPRECQELTIFTLWYFSKLDPSLLQSIAGCCLCLDLEPGILERLLGAVRGAFEDKHVDVGDYVSFLITILSRYEVITESSSPQQNCGLFRGVTSYVCSCLSSIRNDDLVLRMLEEAIIDEISNKPPLENMCALLIVIATLDSNPTKLSHESISKICSILPGYLIGVVSSVPEADWESNIIIQTTAFSYHFVPCFFLFNRSEKIVNVFLDMMPSFISRNYSATSDGQNSHVMIDHSSRLIAVLRVLLLALAFEDAKGRQILSRHKEKINNILHNIHSEMSHEECNMKIEEKHKIQCSYDQLKAAIGK